MTQDPTNSSEPAPEASGDPSPAGEAAAAAKPAEPATPREAEQEAELARLKTELLYAKAETENVRRRLEQQAEERGKYAVANFAKDMLQVADNLRRALTLLPAGARSDDPLAGTLAEGVELTERVLLATFERYGVKRFESLGQPFDPHRHQAMMEIEDPNQPPGLVVTEMQSGYTIHDRLLREAMVGVSKGGAKPPEGGGIDTTV